MNQKRPINLSKEPNFHQKSPERGLHICIHGTWMRLRARGVAQDMPWYVKRALYSITKALKKTYISSQKPPRDYGREVLHKRFVGMSKEPYILSQKPLKRVLVNWDD